MGFNDEYQKLRKKRLEGQNTDNDDKAPAMLYQNKTLPKQDVAPIVTANGNDDEDEDEKRTWFDKGAFEDGYQFGDVIKTVIGTGQDMSENISAGILGMGEKVVDAGAYLVGGAAGLLGADEFKEKTGEFIAKDLYDEKKVAEKFNVVAPFYSGTVARKILGIDESDSLLGDKTDALAQSGGQLLGTIGLQAVGVPWWVTSGTTSFGSAAEGALNEGATYGEAGLSAAISAGAEILTEKLFGGSGLGEKGLFNLEPLTKGISSKVVKALADFGIDMAAEGAEEIASSAAGRLGSALYKEENLYDLLLSEEAFDEYLESFIGGAALGGIANTGNVANSIKTGTDYRTGLTTDEQAVFDNIYNDRIAEHGEKLTKKQKAAIYDQVMRDLERGRISVDDIERILGGETYAAYQNTLNEQKTLQDEYDALYRMKNGEKSDEQIDRQKELKAKLEEIAQKGEATTLETQLHEGVFGRANGTRLAESYRERARRGQAFEADLSRYDAKQAEIVKKAVESGILNNTGRTHEFVDMIAKISADKGVLFDFTNNAKLKESGFAVEGATVNGYFDKKTGTIGVNIDSAKAFDTVVGHEITHVIEGTELYSELQKAVFEYAKTKGDFDSRRQSLAKLYAEEDIDSEMTADLIGEYLFTDEDFVKNLSVQNRNVFQKIYDEIKYLVKVVTAGSKEARELERVKRAFDKAYRESGKADATADVKHSLSDSDGKQLTKGQQEYFKESKMRDENGNLMVMYHGSQDAGFHVFDPGMSDDDISFFFVDRNDVAASYSGTTETYEAQSIRTAEDMNKFIESIGVEGYEVIEHDGKFDLIYEDDLIASRDTAKEIYEEFCWYEGVGEGDANYKVYLNLKNPLVVDGKGRPWNKIDAEFSQEIYDKYQSLTAEEKDALIDLAGWEDFSLFNSEIQEATEGALASAYAKMGEDCNIYDLFSVAADNFSEESMRENARQYLKTRDYAKRAKEQGYDGVIFNNIVDNGGYSNGSEGASTVAIAFDSNQIKSVANENPTGDPDIRFSLSEAVEETNDLMAIHNLTEEKLRKSLKLGGLPMPSVAIARAQDGHNEFGNISLILKKEAIDPETSRYNKVYSGDAWTPTYPRVEYKVNSKVLKQIGEKVNSLVPSDVIKDLGDVHFDTDNMTDTLNRFGGNMVDAFGSNYALKYAYLRDSGVDIALPMKEKNISYYGTRDNGAIIMVAEALTQEELITALNGGHEVADQYEPIIRKAVAEYMQEKYGDVPELLDIMMPREQLTYSELDGYISEALSYHKKGVERTVDTKAARELINEQVNQSEYEAWLNDLFSGIVEKEGIRNNADYFTPSGNRRSFEALHYEHNLENVIKAMREKGAKGVGAFGSGNILGASTTEFGSIKELKQSTDRLRMMSQDEYDKIRKQYTDRFFDLASSLPKDKNSFIATDDAANMLVEAVAKYKTRSGIANYLRRESQGWANYSEYVVDELIELVEDIRKMPTGYFEAKPQRAVGFDEVGVFVIPNNADPKLKQELLNRGYSIAEYDPDVEGDRQKVVNSFEQYKFSLSAEGEAPTKGRFFGKDMRLEVAPIAEDVSTTTEQAAPEAVAPDADWMPDTEETYTPTLYDLIDERDALREQMLAVQDDLDAIAPLAQRYGEVMQQIQQLEADENARLASLDDADVPPEVEAPYVAQREPITIDDKSLEKITGDVGNMLGLDAEDRARMAQTIQKYAQSGDLTESDLFDEILDNYEYYEEMQVENDEADAARRFIKGTKLYLHESLKGDFNGKRKDGFNAFRQEHFGHFTITTQKGAGAMSVDSLYSELSDNFPDLFPADIGNSADMLQRMADVASMKPKTEYRTGQFDPDTVGEVVELIRSGVAQYAQNEKFRAFNKEGDRLIRMYGKTLAPVVDTPTIETASKSEVMGQQTMFEEPAKKDRFEQMLEREMAELEKEFAQRRSEMEARLNDKNAYISGRAMDLYYEISNLKKGVRASKELGYLLDHGFAWNTIKSKLLTIKRYPGEVINPDSIEETTIREMLSREYEDKVYELSELGLEYQKRVTEIEQSVERARKEAEKSEQLIRRAELHKGIIDRIRSSFAAKGFDFDKVLKYARNLSTFATVDNTPQRVMEKALGYKQGQILADETVNKVAQNETEGIRWLNSYTDRKSGILAQISKQYHIKPGSKESAAAQMYAEGFFVDESGDAIFYGDAELARDFPDAKTQENIKGLAADPRIRKIYDETLAMINESRVRNGYPEIPKLDNYFLHFRAMDDTFSRLGLPFNPNDIKAKDLPTDLNGVTADLKPGQPYFASAMHRRGVRTTHDLLGGLERYLTSAKNQIYHIDDIQTLRALRNYIADTYGQANGLDSLDVLTEEEVEERIKQVYGSHLSTFAKFLNEEANVLAGKTALIDRGLEGIIGRRGMTFIDNLNKQVGSNMVGYNISSSLTNFLPVVQTFAKTNKTAFVKGFAQTVSGRLGSIAGGGDGFAQNSPVMIRRQGADRFHRTAWQKLSDPGYALMGAVDSISTEIIARAKYNELIGKGLTSAQAHTVTDKWVSRLMGDRSLGQMPQLYNSKMLGLVTKFQLEVRNQLDSQFYDTIQEAKVSNEHIENQLERNAKTAAKVASTFFQLAVAQHIFGAVFESIAGYNPAFDIIEVIMTALGWDDDEESEDTVLDNVEQGFLALLEDLPYTSTLTGGRIPISNALPIEQLIKGKDEYGNDKPRWKTALEALPYYVSPGGYGQAKKTAQGLKMFSDKLPVTGSYTDSGNLRFPVEETPGNIAQAAIFGQWASENARYYFDNDIAPLNPKQTQEYADVGMSIRDYWKYRKGLSGLKTIEEKAEYIDGLDLTDEQKNILINNIADREEDIDMSDYDQYGSFGEFDFAAKNPEKYEFFKANGISYEDYDNADEDGKRAYTWAYENPEKYTVAKSISDDFLTYYKYKGELNDITADKDENGESIRGSAKDKKIDYINNLDLDYGQRIILFKSLYKADDTYNADIVDYLNEREDISYEDMVTILTELGFTVKNGNVYWE